MGTSAPHGCCLRHPMVARVRGQTPQPPCQHRNINSDYGMLMREELQSLNIHFDNQCRGHYFTTNKNSNRLGRHGQRQDASPAYHVSRQVTQNIGYHFDSEVPFPIILPRPILNEDSKKVADTCPQTHCQFPASACATLSTQ